jgi:signal transduction histidine kinase
MEREATGIGSQGRAQILPPDAGRLSSALRDSGYSFNTALADIVDNSIDAGASQIEVYIHMAYENEIQIFVADNGCGMSKEELIDAMRYGSASKKDAARLGKFGLGLKTVRQQPQVRRW